MPGLDLLLGNNQVVLPPSMHYHAQPYRWITDPRVIPPAPLPQGIIDLAWEEARRVQQQEEEKRERARQARPHGSPFVGRAGANGGCCSAGNAVERARRYVAKILGALSGNYGSKTTSHVACVLVSDFGLSDADALPIFEEWNQTCEPPWTREELLRKLEWANEQPGERGWRLRVPVEAAIAASWSHRLPVR
jgi:hypothetical protein